MSVFIYLLKHPIGSSARGPFENILCMNINDSHRYGQREIYP